MGCTSSAPNMTSSNTDSENDLKPSEEEINENVKKVRDIEISEVSDNHQKEDDAIVETVLPVCEIIDGTTQETLAIDNTSITEAPSLNLQEAVAEHNENGQTESKHSTSATANDKDETLDTSLALPERVPESESTDALEEEKLSTLKEVVEKVVESHALDKLDTSSLEEQSEKNIEETNSESQNTEEAADVATADEPERPPSPSKSSSSRVTRWEALTDAGAELPPSYTVDPLTGQIYMFSR